MNFLSLFKKILPGVLGLSVGLGLHLSSQAQTGRSDTAGVWANGMISPHTCAITSAPFGANPVLSETTKTIDLGSVSRDTNNVAMGVAFGTVGGMKFAAGNRSGTSTCNQTGFDLSFQLTSDQIHSIPSSTLGTTTFLKNSISVANGGTDAVLVLRGAAVFGWEAVTTSDVTQAITLRPYIGNTGNYVSGSPTSWGNNVVKMFTAQFVNSSSGRVLPGRFSQVITLMATYN